MLSMSLPDITSRTFGVWNKPATMLINFLDVRPNVKVRIRIKPGRDEMLQDTECTLILPNNQSLDTR